MKLYKRITKIYNKLVNKYFSKPNYYRILFGPLRGIYLNMPLNAGVNKYLGFYEKEQTKFIAEHLKEGYVCMDMGSHIGYMTMLMAKVVGSKGKVYSFEPLEKDCEMQRKSVEKNGFRNVVINSFGLSNENKEQKAYVFNDSGMAHFEKSVFGLEYGKDTIVLELKKLDDYVKENNINAIDFIKVDVEGYEYNALEGSSETISALSPDLFIEIHNKDNMIKVFGFLKEHGYRVYSLEKTPINLPESFDGIFHVFASKHS